jgi:hypothetical protein
MKPYYWRRRILESTLKSTTRHVLLTLSCYLNKEGDKAYPTTVRLAKETGFSERTVITHLDIAVQEGWLTKSKRRMKGRDWANHQYHITAPPEIKESTETGSAAQGKQALNLKTQGAEAYAQGTEPGGMKALKEVQSSKPMNKPEKLTKEVSRQSRTQQEPRIELTSKPEAADEQAEWQDLPQWLPHGAWFAFLDMRNKQFKPLTGYAKRLVLATLQHFHEQGYDLVEVLDASTRNGWTDVYLPREKQPPTSPHNAAARHSRYSPPSQHRYDRHDRSAAAAAIFGTDGGGQISEAKVVEAGAVEVHAVVVGEKSAKEASHAA